MTVSTTSPTITYTYSGPGDYSYAFLAYDSTDIVVYHISSEGVSSLLVQDTDYTITLQPDYLGGTVTTINPVTSGGTLNIRRELPIEQQDDWVNNDPFNAEILERALDKIVMILQQFDVDISDSNVVTNFTGNWITDRFYDINEITVAPNGNWYVSVVSHTSTVFADDLAAGYWLLALDVEQIETYRDEAQLAASDASAAKDIATTQATASATSAAQAETHKNAAQTAEANSAENAQNSANCRQEAYDQAVIATNAAASIPDPATLVKQTSATGAAEIPTGTTAQRPTAATGLLRFNTTEGSFEGYNGTEWGSIGGGGAIPWEAVQSANFVAEAGKAYPVDCSGGDIIIDASGLSEDDWFIVGDAGYTWGQGTGKCYLENDGVIPIYTSATDDFAMNEQNAVYVWQYRDATRGWMIYDGIGESGPEGGSITTIWTGSAGDGVTIDWSGTGNSISDFDAILIEATDDAAADYSTTALHIPSVLLSLGSCIVPGFDGGDTNRSSMFFLSITETSMQARVSASNRTITATGIYGIKYS